MVKGTSRKLNAVISREIEADVASAVDTAIVTAMLDYIPLELPLEEGEVSAPPILSELVTIFGEPSTNTVEGKSSIVGTLRNTSIDGEGEVWLVLTDGTNYYVQEQTKVLVGSAE